MGYAILVVSLLLCVRLCDSLLNFSIVKYNPIKSPHWGFAKLGISKDCLSVGDGPMISRRLGRNPSYHARQSFGFHSPTGFTDGRQHSPSLVLHTALLPPDGY